MRTIYVVAELFFTYDGVSKKYIHDFKDIDVNDL